ncbi:MAG: hypothetical protein HGB01_01880 [Chlorobiaceae bacterium]|nr:hypothetical protein [Chlorobiaceae bacterium]
MIENELQGLLSKADLALGRLDGSIQTLPHPLLFVFMYVRKEAVLSSQIEGTQSSLQDVRDYGFWEDWLAFFLQGVIEVSKQNLPVRFETGSSPIRAM